MPEPRRLVIPIDSDEPEAWARAVGYAEAIGDRAGSKAGEVILFTTTKNQLKGTSLATHIGAPAAKALLANRTVGLPSGRQLRHATEQTLGGYARGAIIIAYYADEKMLDKLDGISGLAGIVAVPWMPDGIDRWKMRWAPLVHGEEPAAPAPLIEDPVVEAALSALTIRVNTSHGALQARDKEPADETFRILRVKGHVLEPERVKSWAIRKGWNPGAADDLAKIAQRVGALKTKPSLAKMHDPQGRYDRWTQSAASSG